MALYYHHPSSRLHDTGAHPENAGRLVAIERALEQAGWPGLDRVEAPAASREQLLRAHTAEYVDRISTFCAAGGGLIDLDTVAVGASWDAAAHAAGAVAEAAERLLSGEGDSAFCAMRPPGHHAEPDRAMGFCLFNNAAVAATHAIAECGVERAMIVDWDVHHGNGTEAIFAADPDVLYTSIHQWPLYPGTGAAEYAGVGPGEGYTVNLPVAEGTDGEGFLALVEHVICPIARAYEPGLIVVSAGYDAHRDDPLASCMVETEAYGAMTAALREAGADLGAPLVVSLEGGYAPAALAASTLATVSALAGDGAVATAPSAAAEPHLSRLRERWSL